MRLNIISVSETNCCFGAVVTHWLEMYWLGEAGFLDIHVLHKIDEIPVSGDAVALIIDSNVTDNSRVIQRFQEYQCSWPTLPLLLMHAEHNISFTLRHLNQYLPYFSFIPALVCLNIDALQENTKLCSVMMHRTREALILLARIAETKHRFHYPLLQASELNEASK